MKNYNVNILNSNENFTFPITIVERNYSIDDFWFYSKYQNDVYISSKDKITIHEVNNFQNTKLENCSEIPYTNVWDIMLVFPEEHPLYISNYMIDVHIRIGETKVHCFSEKINTKDIVATPKTLVYNGKRYYECIHISIPSPKDIMYEDNWQEFREKICKEKPKTNECESLITFELYPIDNNYIYPDFVGGYTTISLNNGTSDLKHILNFNDDYNIISKITFNEVYEGDFQLYMEETYGLTDIFNNYVIKQEFVLKDKENIYRFFEREIINNDCINNIYNKTDLNLTWSDWCIGMCFISTINIVDKNENEVMVLFSNEVPLTLESFSYLLSKTDKINLEDIDMNIYNLDIVNKIEKRIVQVNNEVDDKSNIINNIFVMSNKIDDLIIYKNVKQNILLPLNGYKNKVDMFYLLIEGVSFSEVGRNQQGVIFKVDGNLLPNKENNGVYHILNKDKDLVTIGKYTYE